MEYLIIREWLVRRRLKIGMYASMYWRHTVESIKQYKAISKHISEDYEGFSNRVIRNGEGTWQIKLTEVLTFYRRHNVYTVTEL